jgi:hypothetical protein
VRIILIGLITAALGGVWAAEPPAAKNLLPNGDFEAGTITPTGWQTIDGLSSFWVQDPDPKRGKVLKFDTDVLQSQAYEWWVKIHGGASPKDAPAKLPTVEPKYDTLAGLDGVWFWSDPISVEKGKAYWLTFDAKGPGPIMAWLVGYPEKPDTSFGADAGAFQEFLKEKKLGKPLEKGRMHEPFLQKYVWRGQLTHPGGAEWSTGSRREKPFRPTAVTPNVKYVRVLLFPFWPPGVYYVDNVRLTEFAEPEKK